MCNAECVVVFVSYFCFFFFKQKTAYEMRISDWSSDVCSSDLVNITSGAVKAPIDILGLSNGARSGLTGFVAGLARQPQLAGNNVTINNLLPGEIGRASCRERVCQYV